MSYFKKRYNNDPVFRSNVLARALELKNCDECGRQVQNNNLSRHKKSKICLRNRPSFNKKKLNKELLLIFSLARKATI